jgi:two-component system, chemotaxis family, CheB/CheR fusion protein
VKNTLTVVQAIAHQTAGGNRSTREFMALFDGRIAALASAHNLLMQSNWEGADLAALAREQVEPYRGDGSGRVQIEGEAVLLPADLATPLGLILYELATNAAKHGAPSVPDGTAALTWSTMTSPTVTSPTVTWATAPRDGAARMLTLTWQERNGPAVAAPTTSGHGSALIERAIPGATVKREFRPDGLHCTIEVPLAEPGA